MKDRIPPHNLDLEESLLSAIFINYKNFSNFDYLLPTDFYKSSHGIIFHAMQNLKKEHQPIDLTTVAEQLRKEGNLEKIGGAAYLTSIADAAPVALHVQGYAKKIKDLAMVRHAIFSCMSIIDEAYKTNDPEEFVGKAQESILSLKTTTAKDKFVDLDNLVIDAMERISLAQKGDYPQGLDFGFPVLGSAMHICGSKLIVLAARPGMGKTGLMLSTAKYLGYQGVKNTIISIEMDKEALTDRFLSDEADVNSLCFYSPGSVSEKSMSDLEMASSRLSKLPVYIDDSECKIEDVERKCRKAKKMGSEIIFIDQLSKIVFPANLSEFQGYTRNCNRIAVLKKELRIPIVLLCQLNRNVEDRQIKRPMLSDLKQTGAIEEDADMIFFIYRPGYYEKLKNPKDNPDQSRTEIILAKNRNGGTGVENNVLFKAKRGMFRLNIRNGS